MIFHISTPSLVEVQDEEGLHNRQGGVEDQVGGDVVDGGEEVEDDTMVAGRTVEDVPHKHAEHQQYSPASNAPQSRC